MALILNTKYNPFTYQEMLAPVLAATQAHQALEAEATDLATRASIWDGMADEQKDPETYKRYKAFANALQQQIDDLARNGLSNSSRKGLLSMKTRYAKDIVPIEQAYKRREELAKEQRAALANNPTLRYQRMMGQTSLDDFINDSSLDYGQSYSGALLTKQVSDIMSDLSKTLQKENIGKLQSIGLPYQYQQLIQKGFTPSQVMMAMMEGSNSDPETVKFLRSIVDEVLQSSGVYKWADPTTMAEFRAFANQGLYRGIGEISLQAFKDDYSMQRSLQKAAATNSDEDDNQSFLNPTPLRSREEMKKANDKVSLYIKKGFLIRRDGKLLVTEEGKKEYFKIEKNKPNPKLSDKEFIDLARVNSPSQLAKKGLVVDGNTKFRDFMDSLGAAKFVGKNSKGEWSIQPGNMGNLVQQYLKNNEEGSYDTYHSTEYTEYLNSSYGDQFMKAAKENAANGKFEVVEFKDRQFKPTGEVLNVEDLKNYTVSSKRISKHGNTMFIQPKDGEGKVFRVRIPQGINITSESNVAGSIQAADDYQAVINTGKIPRQDSNGRFIKDSKGNIIFTNTPLSEEDYIVLLHEQQKHLKDMGRYSSTIVVPTETETFKQKSFQ